MVARVSLNVGSPYAAVVIPKDALVLKGGKEYVFIAESVEILELSEKLGKNVSIIHGNVFSNIVSNL